MPVDDELGVAEEAYDGCDGEGGDGRWVLNQHVARWFGGVAEGAVEGPGLVKGFEGGEDGEEEFRAGAEEGGR